MLKYFTGECHAPKKQEQRALIIANFPSSAVDLADDKLPMRNRTVNRNSEFHVVNATIKIDVGSFKMTLSTVSYFPRTFVE